MASASVDGFELVSSVAASRPWLIPDGRCDPLVLTGEGDLEYAALPVVGDPLVEVVVCGPSGMRAPADLPLAPSGEAAQATLALQGQTAEAEVIFLVLGTDAFEEGAVRRLSADGGDAEVVAFGVDGAAWPLEQSVTAAARDLGYVAGGYVTCASGGDSGLDAAAGAPAGAARGRRPRAVPQKQQLEALTGRVDSIEGALGRIETLLTTAGAAGAGPRASVATAKSEVRPPAAASALREARAVLGEARPRLPEVPGRGGKGVGAAPGRGEGLGAARPPVYGLNLPLHVDDEEEVDTRTRGTGSSSSAATPMELAMIGLLQEIQADRREARAERRKKGTVPGLEQVQCDDREESEVALLPGARGSLMAARLHQSMQAHPREFARVIERNMARQLEEDDPVEDEHGAVVGDGRLAARYIESEIAMGKQKVLGHMVSLLAHIHSQLMRGRPDAARLTALLGLASADQYCLDNNWTTAWELTGLRQPPWGAWASADVEAIRRRHVASPLLQPEWAAAYVGKAKDEETLLKRRGGKSKGRDGAAPPDPKQ